MRKGILLGVALSLVGCVAVLHVGAAWGQDDEEDRPEQVEEVDAGPAEWDDNADDDDDEILARNVRLDFKVLPEGDDDGTFIICAASYYEADSSWQTDTVHIEFGVEGEVELREEEGKIFVAYDVHLAYKGPEGHGRFRAASGVLLAPGQELGVAKFDDRVVMISASYVDE